jgi:hypothetical protein
MADETKSYISKIQLPTSDNIYYIKDEEARAAIASLDASVLNFIGVADLDYSGNVYIGDREIILDDVYYRINGKDYCHINSVLQAREGYELEHFKQGDVFIYNNKEFVITNEETEG